MTVLLQIKNAHKSYGDQVLLDDAEVTLVDDVKVGFVGRNGAGKSTLLRVSAGRGRTRQRVDRAALHGCGSATCGSTTRFCRAKRRSNS